MKSALSWLWWDVLSWRSPHPFVSGALFGMGLGILTVVIGSLVQL